jgi:hypothetical protein
MGYRELHRMEIEEVVRRWRVNESQRAIARATGLARETVKKYLAAAGDLGLSATGPHVAEVERDRTGRGCSGQAADWEEAVGAVAVSEVEVLPRFPRGRRAAHNSLAVDENLDRAHITGEIASVCVRFGQGGRRNPGIVLGGRWRTVAKPRLELKERHRFLRGCQKICSRSRNDALAGLRGRIV